jgi:acyl-CoA thioester hydrolase
MPLPIVPVAQIQMLRAMDRFTIAEEHIDIMGHMNVRWYLAFFDEAGWKFFQSFGMDDDYYRQNHTGGFALQHFIHYLAEVRLGETVAIYCRMVARSAKRIHMMYFMVNETTGKLAATLEGLGSHADLTVRRTSPYPPELAARIDALIAEQDALGWDVPISGAIQP